MKRKNIKFKGIIFPILLTIFMFISIRIGKCFARISKEGPDEYCNVCHTGGNATDGTTNQTCIECHSSSASSTYYDLGGYRVPVVNYTGTMAPANYLAGGNFWWVKEGNEGADDSKGHNVFPGEVDDKLDIAPGGIRCFTNSCHSNFHIEYKDQLDIGLNGRQGCTGCHMVDDLRQPNGFHHADEGEPLDVINAYPWYRFLKGHSRARDGGVEGIEDPNRQANNESGPVHHNEYLGEAGGNTIDSWSLGYHNTITAFCCGCHGKFHIQQKVEEPNEPWIRHPSDTPLPDYGEYKGYITYNPMVPVARQDLSNLIGPDNIKRSKIDPGNDLVSCISCHRPHGSPYPDMLRWNPNTCEGCIVCHTQKSSNSGPCNKCHTIHHSQDGVDPYIFFDPIKPVSTGPNSALLFGVAADPNENNSTCIVCHSGSSSVINGYDTFTKAPQIDLTGDAILAGGTFAGTPDAARHNVLGFAPPDKTLGTPNVPPGGWNDDIGGADQITCAGTTGCHGNRAEPDNITAVYGAHHADEGDPLDGSTVGKSYRFLSTDSVDVEFSNSGVLGLEHSNRESSRYITKSQITAADASEHNVYDADSINTLCGSCHRDFHGEEGQGGPGEPWLRHPTDIALDAAAASGPAEYADYPEEGDAVNKYSTEAPVGYDASAGNNQIGVDIAKTQGQVLCISCHRPHGSPYPDMLRWDPDTCKGCITCHTQKSLVNGPCNKCHNMHNSQDGVAPHIFFDLNKPISLGPNNALLFGFVRDPNENNSSCVGCHSGSSSVINGYDTFTKAPQIDLTSDAMLAGGTFAGTADSVRHNVLGFAPPDKALGTPNVPPGGANDDIGSAKQITCAGTTGCHGNRAEPDNITAVYGAHHMDQYSPLDGSTVGKSYRLLSTDLVNHEFNNSGVLGIEHLNWESGRYNTKSQITAADASEHNVYDADGINKLCASCHGNFHGDASQGGPSEPWLRHPTDITLDAANAIGPAEYADYPEEGDAINKYSPKAPVGYDASAGNNQIGLDVAKTQGQVLCISCHRPHGSPYPDMLRWDPNTYEGCIVCHTQKSSTKGRCFNCHTMHYSQDGVALELNLSEWSTEGPYHTLLTKDCLGCHSSNVSSTYYDLDGYRVPVVNYTGPDAPANYLAGGNFWWVKEGNEGADDSKGHNVFPGEKDDKLSKAPGGITCSSNSCHDNFDREYTGSWSYPGLYKRQGCTGCHMVDDILQPSGYHHADDGNQYDIINNFPWYRFLKSHIRLGGIYGVIGIEDSKWQAMDESDSENHNEYLGKEGAFTSDSWSLANNRTMTAFCCGCHGKFHMQQKEKGQYGHWIRHPSDATLPDYGEYKDYNTYNPEVPVARSDPGSINSIAVTPGEDLVSCISCHRPHGSPYPDMLRWDPDTCDGCITCHTQKSSSNGPCNKCHTMHNSQDGVPIELSLPEWTTEGPYHTLLIQGCSNCHSSRILFTDINLKAGWSMISLPVFPESSVISQLFPEAVVTYGFEKGVGYKRLIEEEELEVGKGYWILFYSDQNCALTGQSIPKYNLPVYENGWYMIGGCTTQSRASINTGNIIVIYGYIPGVGYERVLESKNLEPGKGYWIFFSDIADQAELTVKNCNEHNEPINSL
ncbi:MAG: cytochrome c3 family protein [bacterium]